MAGDSVKNFVWRRLRIPPGAPWIPFDQLDFVLGALVLVAPRARPSACGTSAYWLGIRDVKW
jgi:CDP-2,3-bis-(O-geranylgeranyl)-sn-glycerol synthase